jgi:hypothetical protein
VVLANFRVAIEVGGIKRLLMGGTSKGASVTEFSEEQLSECLLTNPNPYVSYLVTTDDTKLSTDKRLESDIGQRQKQVLE